MSVTPYHLISTLRSHSASPPVPHLPKAQFRVQRRQNPTAPRGTVDGFPLHEPPLLRWKSGLLRSEAELFGKERRWVIQPNLSGPVLRAQTPAMQSPTPAMESARIVRVQLNLLHLSLGLGLRDVAGRETNVPQHGDRCFKQIVFLGDGCCLCGCLFPAVASIFVTSSVLVMFILEPQQEGEDQRGLCKALDLQSESRVQGINHLLEVFLQSDVQNADHIGHTCKCTAICADFN